MANQSVTRGERFDYIDGLRAIAVLGVVFFHAFHRVLGPHFAPYLFYVGSHGVDLFFVLSGFCLSLRAVSSSHVKTARAAVPLQFIISRFARIAPPYYVALGLFAILSFTPFGLPTAPGSDSTAITALPELVRDVFFNVPKSPAYNGSFWTLGIEMRWYCFYPILISVFLRSKIWFACIALAAYAWYATPWSVSDAGTLPCFMLGIVAASLATSHARPLRELVYLTAVVVVFLAVAKQCIGLDIDHGDALWHVASFSLVLAGGYEPLRQLLSAKPLRAVGVASYSIYLVHQPFLEWFATHGVPPGLAAIGSVGVGFGFWFAIERVVAKSLRNNVETWTSAMLSSLQKQSSLDTPQIPGTAS